MRVAIYVRVSTKKQSLVPQFAELRRYAASRGWQVAAVYRDRDRGRNIARKGYKAMMHAAAMNRFQLVLVWKLDRFGRSGVEIVRRLMELDRYGCGFTSATQGMLDTSSSHGKLLVQILAAFAEFESDLISERVTLGAREAKANGVRLGRPPKAPDAATIIAMLQAGKSRGKTAEALGISHRTLLRVLERAQAPDRTH